MSKNCLYFIFVLWAKLLLLLAQWRGKEEAETSLCLLPSNPSCVSCQSYATSNHQVDCRVHFWKTFLAAQRKWLNFFSHAEKERTCCSLVDCNPKDANCLLNWPTASGFLLRHYICPCDNSRVGTHFECRLKYRNKFRELSIGLSLSSLAGNQSLQKQWTMLLYIEGGRHT